MARKDPAVDPLADPNGPGIHIQREGKAQPQYARQWYAMTALSDRVIVTNLAVLTPAQDRTFVGDEPDTHEMTWRYWRDHHAEYGLAEDGSPLGVAAVKEAPHGGGS